MLIAGAKGHALEILDLLLQQFEERDICFFDNISASFEIDSINKFRIIRTEKELFGEFQNDNRFVLGVGNSMIRKKITSYLSERGGVLCSAISTNAVISKLNVQLGKGLNIMHGSVIQPEVSIGDGTLINAGALIHHESTIGEYCEICPGAIITGNVEIGSFTKIGSGATILPGIKIGSYVVVAAGAVVTKNIPDNALAIGVPAVVKNLSK